MIGVHQAYAGGDDAVAIKVDIIAKSDVVSVFERDQFGHGIRARTVHADFAVAVESHKREGFINPILTTSRLRRFFGMAANRQYLTPKGSGRCECRLRRWRA